VTWTFIFTPEIWPMAAMLCLLLLLAVYSWRRRSVQGALPFMVSCLFAILMTTGLLLANLASDPGSRSFWLRFMFSWVLPAVAAVTCFILEYAWPGRWLTRRNLILLSILPLFSVLFFLGGYTLLVPIGFVVGETVTLPLNVFGQISIVYFFGLTFINLIVFIWLFIRSPQHRWPVLLMAASQISMRFIVFGQEPSLAVQTTNIPAFMIPYLAYATALFGFRIFDPIPLARQTAIDHLQAGMIILDPGWRVVSLNPSAEKILNMPNSQAKHRPVRELLAVCSDDLFHKLPAEETECDLGSRSFTLSISPLKDFRGMVSGYLLMLRDITEQKLAQAQILEQQRALATQDERERMARELHDSLGQVLSYASMQVETAAMLSRNGLGEAAEAQLDRLGSVVRQAHADLREYILNLRSTASLQQPFFVTIQHYLENFTTNYEIQTLLEISPDLNNAVFSPEVQLQLFRILQEALSNARKHGQAHQVQISFSLENSSLRIVIQDDGCGFNMEEIVRRSGSHFGFQFMRERAERLAGSLELTSTPGSGTRVELVVPWKED